MKRTNIGVSALAALLAGSIAALAANMTIDGSLVVGGSVVQGTSAPALSGEKSTTLSTIGAGTITAAGIFGGVTSRGGAQVAGFTDTTDTAAAIFALLPANTSFPVSFEYTYLNTTSFAATIAGGVGVTVSGVTVVPIGGWQRYLVSFSNATTATMSALAGGNTSSLQISQFTTSAAASPLTAPAGALTGAQVTTWQNTTNGAFALTTRTAALMLADSGMTVGQSYVLVVNNTGNATVTITGGTGVTVNTATIATNTARTYVVTFNTATTATMQSVGTQTAP